MNYGEKNILIISIYIAIGLLQQSICRTLQKTFTIDDQRSINNSFQIITFDLLAVTVNINCM